MLTKDQARVKYDAVAKKMNEKLKEESSKAMSLDDMLAIASRAAPQPKSPGGNGSSDSSDDDDDESDNLDSDQDVPEAVFSRPRKKGQQMPEPCQY